MGINDKGVVKRAIVTPDKHAPLHDVKAISVVKQAIEIIKPDIYVDLGDLGEFAGCSHWQWKRKKKPPLEFILPKVEQDIKAVNELLDMGHDLFIATTPPWNHPDAWGQKRKQESLKSVVISIMHQVSI